jgi:hypothetical protein
MCLLAHVRDVRQMHRFLPNTIRQSPWEFALLAIYLAVKTEVDLCIIQAAATCCLRHSSYGLVSNRTRSLGGIIRRIFARSGCTALSHCSKWCWQAIP